MKKKYVSRPLLSLISALIPALFTVADFAAASDTSVTPQSMAPEKSAQLDAVAPDTFITVPGEDSTAGRTTVFTGYATDVGESGIHRVQIAIRSRTTEEWYSFVDQTFGPIQSSDGKLIGITDAELSNASTTRVDWSISITLPDGEYQFFALAIDNAANSQYTGSGVWPVNTLFSVK